MINQPKSFTTEYTEFHREKAKFLYKNSVVLRDLRGFYFSSSKLNSQCFLKRNQAHMI
jgi:hypothetical protein